MVEECGAVPQNSQFICINCGRSVRSLYKKYSPTVLKLTECENCHDTADKYVEYDIIIIMIDLVLLQKPAYIHILFNAEFKNFWKLTIVLLLMETYSIFVQEYPIRESKSETKPTLDDSNLDTRDLEFYKICLHTATRSSLFAIIIFTFTILYNGLFHKKWSFSFWLVVKMITISSFGLFLLLPSLIWDSNIKEFHIHIISLYITLSQLLAYTAMCQCTKLWSIAVIFASHYFKSFLS